MATNKKTIGFYGGKFLPLHQGHVSLIIQASNLCDKLYVILSHSTERDKSLCLNSKIDYTPAIIRLRWLKQITKDMSNVEVIDIEDNYIDDSSYNWQEGADQIKEKIGQPIDYVFSSEPSYDEIFKRLYPGSEHIVMDRNIIPISATMIRNEGVFKHWDMIPNVAKPSFVKKVMVVGTESCGKSTLVRNLAKYYNTEYVEEYGRIMCEEIAGCDDVITPDLFPFIAYGHKMLEFNKLKTANKVLFIDTESLVTKFYLELYTGEKNDLYDKIAENHKYDIWIYLEPDVEWVDDGLRVHGNRDLREANNNRLKEILKGHNIKYHSITGNYQERFVKSINLINNLLT